MIQSARVGEVPSADDIIAGGSPAWQSECNEERDARLFESFAGEVRTRVEDRLRRAFGAELEQLESLGRSALMFGETVHDFTLRGGKRFRAVLLATGYAAVAPHADLEPAILAGAAFELLQSAFLIHDDIMDRDTMRRGGPTVHVALGNHLEDRALGESAAILAGDYALALAQEVLASAAADPPAVLAAMACFAQVQTQTIRGQLLDITAKRTEANDFTLEDLKTGSYTVRGPLVIGATLAGADARVLQACMNYARPLGVAFQLRDDLLGLLGDSAKTGKPWGTDIRAGKMTHVVLSALERLDPERRRILTSALGNAEATSIETARAVECIVDSGAVEATETRIAELTSAALLNLTAEAGFSEPGLGFLRCLTARFTRRDA